MFAFLTNRVEDCFLIIGLNRSGVLFIANFSQEVYYMVDTTNRAGSLISVPPEIAGALF